MAIHDLKDQIARLPEQPGVYLWRNAAGDTIYVGKARSLRDRVRSYLGAYGMSPRHDALLDEIARLEVIVTDSVMEALALENNLIKQRIAALQHPAARRQELPIPAADDERGVSARARGAARREGRRLLRRTVSARQAGAADDDAVAPAVRHPVVQRGDHRHCARGRASSTTSSAASRRAWRRSAPRSGTAWRWPARRLLLEGRNDELVETLRDRMAEASQRRALRGGRAAARRDAHGADAARSPAEGGDRRTGRPRRVRAEGRPERRRDPGFPMRGGRVVERVELVTDPGGDRRRRARTCCRRRCSQFYELRAPPAEINLPLEIEDVEAMEEWLSSARRPARAGSSCRSAATSARWWSWPRATRSCRTARGSTRSPPRTSTRSRRCAASSACRRFHAASNASTSRRSRAARRWRRWSSAKTAG